MLSDCPDELNETLEIPTVFKISELFKFPVPVTSHDFNCIPKFWVSDLPIGYYLELPDCGVGDEYL